MSGRPQSKLVQPPGMVERGLTFSPTTWSCVDRFVYYLPRLFIALGALFLIIGIIITALSYNDNVSYDGGITAGPVLMVLGTVLIVVGLLWLLCRRAYSSSYDTKYKGQENPSYISNEAEKVQGASSLKAGMKGPSTSGGAMAAPEDVKIVLGYVPAQKEDWQTGDIYQPNVV